MIEFVTKFCEAAEDITDELTEAAGSIVTKATPLLAPLASGATVLFACYDGIGRMIANLITYPYAVSFMVGLVLSAAIEGVNFASQHARDRTERLKASQGVALDYVKAGSLVTQSFWLTIAVILFLESIPGAVAWYNGELGASDMAFRFGLLVLPFFSRIGARIFSISTILDAIEGTQESRRAQRLQAQREKVAFDLEIETMRKKAALDVAQMEATTQRRIERGGMRVVQNRDKKLNSVSAQNHETEPKLNSVSQTEQPTILNPIEKMNEAKQRKIEARHNAMLDIIRREELGVGDLAGRLGVSDNTIRKDLKALQDAGHSMSVNGVVKLQA